MPPPLFDARLFEMVESVTVNAARSNDNPAAVAEDISA
jgi:hypothetical protein